MAHEMRELGEYDKMLKTYLELADKHPKSEYRLEGLLVVGDYYFDKAELDQAEKYYQMVIDSPETRVHAMARYKLAWCKINRADFKGALKLFEGSVSAARKWLAWRPARAQQRRRRQSKIDLRREALVDSVSTATPRSTSRRAPWSTSSARPTPRRPTSPPWTSWATATTSSRTGRPPRWSTARSSR